MMVVLYLVLVGCVAYFIGAVPFGYLVAKSKGVDILSNGSGNIGATNVGRTLGRKFGVLVFVLDFTKGALPAWIAGGFSPPDLPVEWAQVTAGVAAFLGHLFPVYLGFRGGKGVATGAGVVAVLVPGPTIGALLTWVTIVAATRYISLASITAAIALCGLRITLTPDTLSGPRGVVTGFCLVAAFLVAARHRANIGRLMRGNENRLKEGNAVFQLNKTLHVLAMGLWFGSAVFFTYTGVVVFGTFEQIAEKEAADRPAWLPLPALYDQAPPSRRFPDPMRKEQGARAGGAVVAPLFPFYFGLQTACGAVALLTALSWTGLAGARSKLRVGVLAIALATVLAGWFLEWKVSELRVPRDEKTDELLRIDKPSAEEIFETEAARRTFVQWHLASVFLNLVTLGLVTAAMTLVAWLPASSVTGAEPLSAGMEATLNGSKTAGAQSESELPSRPG